MNVVKEQRRARNRANLTQNKILRGTFDNDNLPTSLIRLEIEKEKEIETEQKKEQNPENELQKYNILIQKLEKMETEQRKAIEMIHEKFLIPVQNETDIIDMLTKVSELFELLDSNSKALRTHNVQMSLKLAEKNDYLAQINELLGFDSQVDKSVTINQLKYIKEQNLKLLEKIEKIERIKNARSIQKVISSADTSNKRRIIFWFFFLLLLSLLVVVVSIFEEKYFFSFFFCNFHFFCSSLSTIFY
eukprot:c21295_g3_i1.p2 GENE.c21295_g3_i1~~c21295_g3_i1.p2  ORF type:complete len:246 (+),score=64.77 c21295_g3_i1:81-818(+)